MKGQDSLLLQTELQDAWIWSLDQAAEINFGEKNQQNGGLNNVIRAEVWQWQAPRFDTIRNLIQFSPAIIPPGKKVRKALLSLYFFSNPQFTPHSGENALDIHLLSSPWAEELVCWKKHPDYDKKAIHSFPPATSAKEDYLRMDITLAVQQWLSAPEKYFGLLLKMQKEDDFKGLSFASSEHESIEKRPQVILYFE
jgi:hypothetical protein